VHVLVCEWVGGRGVWALTEGHAWDVWWWCLLLLWHGVAALHVVWLTYLDQWSMGDTMVWKTHKDSP
jgi:hypothetical protein